MEYIMIWIVPAIGGIIWYVITQSAVRAPGVSLNKKFISLGVITGKTLNEIVNVCGQPSAISALGDGTILRQWYATGYHISLLFDKNDICLGVSNEISV